MRRLQSSVLAAYGMLVLGGSVIPPAEVAMHRIRSLALASFVILASVAAAHARQLDYRNWDEGALAMLVQSALYDEGKLYVIGESSIPGIYQSAMLISEDAEVEDGGTKNAVLFECGMHSREWFATESC
jgi:hypothetical protein